MNEQNTSNQNPQQGNNGVVTPNNLNQNMGQVQQPVQAQQPVQNLNVPTGQPAIEPLPTPTVGQVQTTAQVQPQQVQQAVQPVQQPVQPVQQVVQPTQPVEQNVVGTTPQVVNTQPVQAVQPQVVQEQPVQQVQPVVDNVVQQPIQNVVSQEPVQNINIAPQEPVNQFQNIQEQQPLNPIPQQPSTPHDGMFSPSIPLNGTDATQVGFVPSSEALPKKKNKPLIIGISVAVVLIVALIGYFVVYPFVLRTFFSNPMNVYETSINRFYKGITATTNDIIHNKAIYDISLSVDSNIESLKNFSGYTYGVNFGVDPDKELLQMGYNIKNNENDNEYGAFTYIKDGKEYLKYSTRDGYIYNGEIDLEEKNALFGSYKEMFDNANNLDNDDIDYLINKLSELSISSINEDKLYKEDTTLEINGETTKVTSNKYEIDIDTFEEMVKHITGGLKSDSKTIELLAKFYDSSEDEVEEMLDELEKMFDEKEDYDKDLVYTFNIYTYGNKSEIIGFGITSSKQDFELQYYNKDNYFELNGKTVVENEMTGKTEENTIVIVGKTDNGKTNVSVKVNDSEILTLTITSWTDAKKELSYNLKYDEYKFNGKISSNYDINDKRLKYSLTIDVNTGDEYIKVTLAVDEDWDSEVSYINTDNAVTLTDTELENEKTKFNNSLMETPLGTILGTVSGDYNSSMNDYYNNYGYGFDDDDDYDNLYKDDDNFMMFQDYSNDDVNSGVGF